MSVILEYHDLGLLRFPRYYNTDPKRANAEVFIAPPAYKNGTITLEYIALDDSLSDTLGDQPWNGLFPGFHELVAYRAAIRAFEASLEDDRAQYMLQRSQGMLQAFALFLGKADVAAATVGQGVSAS
jgi:hypothetical protein